MVKLGSFSATENRVSDVASNVGGLSVAGTNSWENINRKDDFMHALCFILFSKKQFPAGNVGLKDKSRLICAEIENLNS